MLACPACRQLGQRNAKGCGNGHGRSEQGLLLAGLVPPDLPRVHSGGFRQGVLVRLG
jgi:hypothetical protein